MVELAQPAAAAALTVGLLFLAWELVEQRWARSDATAHRMHYARGVSTSFLTAAVVGWLTVWQARRRRARLEAEVAARTRQAAEARALLEQIFDATPAGLLVVDATFRIVQANRVARRVHALPLVGLACSEVLPCACPSGSEPCPFARPSSDAAPPSIEFTDRRTGELVEVAGGLLPRGDGEPLLLLVERVVTERRKLQERVAHQDKMAAFGLLAAGIAHDMGNPLSSVGAQLQLLDGTGLSADASDSLATVRVEVARLERTLRELVSFARRRGDSGSLVSVHGVVQDALTVLRHDPRTRRVHLEVRADPDTAPVFLVEDHLVHVVLNLAFNALDAMPSGGKLAFEIAPAHDDVVLRVRDTGTGMAPEVLARAFDPLYTTKPPGSGSGLGLAVARDIVAAAGGRIGLTSALGEGTTVEVALPRAPDPDASDGVGAPA